MKRKAASCRFRTVFWIRLGVSRNGDLIIETVPGVILIGEKEPVKTVNQPLLDLFQAIGIEPEEVTIETMTEG